MTKTQSCVLVILQLSRLCSKWYWKFSNGKYYMPPRMVPWDHLFAVLAISACAIQFTQIIVAREFNRKSHINTGRQSEDEDIRVGRPPRKLGLTEIGTDLCKNVQKVAWEYTRKPHIDRCRQLKISEFRCPLETPTPIEWFRSACSIEFTQIIVSREFNRKSHIDTCHQPKVENIGVGRPPRMLGLTEVGTDLCKNVQIIQQKTPY